MQIKTAALNPPFSSSIVVQQTDNQSKPNSRQSNKTSSTIRKIVVKHHHEQQTAKTAAEENENVVVRPKIHQKRLSTVKSKSSSCYNVIENQALMETSPEPVETLNADDYDSP